MKKLKPFAVVFVLGVAVVAFGLAGQQALSEGTDSAQKSDCAMSAKSGCGMAKAAALAKAKDGGCGDAAASEKADLSTKEGRRQKVMAEFAAMRNADSQGGACCAEKTAAMAKAGGEACGAKAEGSACDASVAAKSELTGVQAAIADMKSGKLDLASGKYGPAVTAAVVTALYAVAEEEACASGQACELTGAKMAAAKDEACKDLCPVAMAKHGKTSETAAKAAVEAVRAIDNGSCPYTAVAAAMPASGDVVAASDEKKDCEGKEGCDGKKDCDEKKSCCGTSSCEKNAVDEKVEETRMNQQAKATLTE